MAWSFLERLGGCPWNEAVLLFVRDAGRVCVREHLENSAQGDLGRADEGLRWNTRTGAERDGDVREIRSSEAQVEGGLFRDARMFPNPGWRGD